MRVTRSRNRTIIGYCADEEVSDLQRFIDRNWRKGHVIARDEGLLRWQFDPIRAKDSPVGGASVLLAREGAEAVGMLGLIPFDLNVRGATLKGCWLSQWYCTPDARLRGVGLDLLNAARESGYDAMFALGLNEVAGVIYSALGFDMLPDLPRSVEVFDVPGTAELIEESSWNGDREACLALAKKYATRRVEPGGLGRVAVTQQISELGKEWDVFWRAKLAPTLIGPARDSSYLNWRYLSHPRYSYQVRLARNTDSDDLLGMAVFRVEQIRDKGTAVMRVLDFLSMPEAQAPLAVALAEAANTNGVLFADYYGTATDARDALAHAGIRPYEASEDGPSFPTRFQPLEGGYQALRGAFWTSDSARKAIGQWTGFRQLHVTKSDSDQDRPN